MADDEKVTHLKVIQSDEPSNKELLRNLLKEAGEVSGFPINLNLRLGHFQFSGSASGNGIPETDSVSITIHGMVHKFCYPLAAVRFNRENWEEFKRIADRFFDSLPKAPSGESEND